MWHNRLIPNHDTMLRTYPGADGMKTGYTDFAGHNLVTSAVHGNTRLIGVVMGAASNTERDQNMAMLLDQGFGEAGSRLAGGGFGASLITFANAAPLMFQQARQPERSVLVARPPREHAIQVGTFQAERNAWEVAREAARLMPNGEARVQPMIAGRRTVYDAQLLKLTEAEARTVCSNLPRRGPACQVFKIAQR